MWQKLFMSRIDLQFRQLRGLYSTLTFDTWMDRNTHTIHFTFGCGNVQRTLYKTLARLGEGREKFVRAICEVTIIQLSNIPQNTNHGAWREWLGRRGGSGHEYFAVFIFIYGLLRPASGWRSSVSVIKVFTMHSLHNNTDTPRLPAQPSR